MKSIHSHTIITSEISGDQILRNIEEAGRTCYKSELDITKDSSRKFVAMLINKGHTSVLEHEKITVRFIIDRGVSHELVRHRLASFSQESTRYCNYTKNKFGSEITVIDISRHFTNAISFNVWRDAMIAAEDAYNQLIENGESPQIARSVLPNSLKTEIVITANLREWRLIFTQRTSKAAHPQMQEVMIPLLTKFKELVPVVFDDIQVLEIL